MKALKLKFSFLLVVLTLFCTNSFAYTLDIDTFDSTTDGWSGIGVTQDSGKLLIDSADTASKTFTFSAIPNETVTFTLDATEIGTWDSLGSVATRDTLKIYVDDTLVFNDYLNNTISLTFDATLNSFGSTTIKIMADSNNYTEDVAIDNIYVTSVSDPKTAPTIVPETFTIPQDSSIGTYVGTVLTYPYTTSFTINSGNIDNLFSINNNGDISVINSLDTNSTDLYNLNISATNAYGTSSEIISVNLIVDIPLSEDAINTRDFTNVPILGEKSINIYGSILQIGNQILCKNSYDFDECEEPDAETQNNNYNQFFARIDNSVNHSNTMAKLVLQEDDEIIFARLYWSARINTATDDEIENGKKIKIKGPKSSSYTQFESKNLNYNWHNSGTTLGEGSFDYSASTDITDYVKINRDGEYYVGDIEAESGTTNIYASWQLIVVVQNKNRSLKNIAIYDGFYSLYNNYDYPDTIIVPATDFITPTGSVPFNANLFLYAGESDDGYDDSSSILKADGITWIPLIDGQNDVNDVMNASVSSPDYTDGYRSNDTGMADPNYRNVLGVDIDKLVINDKNDPTKQILSNSQTSTMIKLSSGGDLYSLNMFAFETEVYFPEFCYDYSIKQDGSYLNVDRDAYPVARLDSTISSSPLEITVYLKNIRSDFPAEGLSIKSDVNESKFTQIGNIFTSNTNGSTLIDRGDPAFTSPLCDYDKLGDNSLSNSGCTDGHNIRKGLGSLDEGDYVYAKFFLSPLDLSGLVAVDEPLGLSLKYYITAGGNKIEYPDYILGSDNVPLCTTSDAYEPTWGMFNVVESGQENECIKNNLYTKISRNPFDVNVVFDSTPTTGDNTAPTSDINTTVLVEIIDMDAFGDINASCANPDSSLSSPIFTPINFSPSSFQTLLTQQPADYYNFAVKNASFRIWYFADNNGSLIQNWSADTDTSNTVLNAVYGLYQNEIHTICEEECIQSTSVECFECIRANYAQPICSRDNFSIRPESYNVKIFDIDHNASAITKDLTKYNISNQDGFDPGSNETYKTMNLAAGYEYRFDIDATGYDGLMAVPGYTRYFNGSPDYNATLKWDSSGLSCNDDSDHILKFYIANGVMLNKEQKHSNVGQYKVNIIDKTWTAVDYLNNQHHVASKSFETTSSDCIINSTATVLSNKRYGCFINTDHGFDNAENYFQDHKIEFHPYKFDMTSITPSHGRDNNQSFNTNTFIYMTDMQYNSNQDQNMSFHLNGQIGAVGKDEILLNNFVDGCYAKDIDLKISRSNLKLSTHADQRYVFHNVDIPANYQSGSINNLIDTIELDNNNFKKTNLGKVNTILNINFHKDINYTQNPETITYTKYSVNCNDPDNDCQMNADLTTDFQAQANMDLNKTIVYLYGRSYAPRYRFLNPTNQQVLIYYEVYCDGTIDGNSCNKSLLPDGINSNTNDDPRWFINTKHTANAGTAGDVNQKGYAINDGYVTQNTAPTGNHQDSVWITYDESKGYPYKTTMQLNSSRWLIYNKYNTSATVNEFEVEYNSGDTSWGGKAETNSTTVDGGASKTNRRYMW